MWIYTHSESCHIARRPFKYHNLGIYLNKPGYLSIPTLPSRHKPERNTWNYQYIHWFASISLTLLRCADKEAFMMCRHKAGIKPVQSLRRATGPRIAAHSNVKCHVSQWRQLTKKTEDSAQHKMKTRKRKDCLPAGSYTPPFGASRHSLGAVLRSEAPSVICHLFFGHKLYLYVFVGKCLCFP